MVDDICSFVLIHSVVDIGLLSAALHVNFEARGLA